MSQVYTTSEAARICNLGTQTIVRRFDSGDLGGYRLPGSGQRRIPRESLRQFMAAHGIPTHWLDPDPGPRAA